MDTESFISYIKEYYRTHFSLELPESIFNEWVFTEGLPEKCPQPVSVKFDSVDLFLEKWNNGDVHDESVAKNGRRKSGFTF